MNNLRYRLPHAIPYTDSLFAGGEVTNIGKYISLSQFLKFLDLRYYLSNRIILLFSENIKIKFDSRNKANINNRNC